jgi:alkylation response protein AidB-like acyl-CoA dehydrogenase
VFADETFDDDDPAARLAWIDRHRTTLERVPLPGSGRSVERLRALAALGAVDGSLARLVEGHLDALAILDELGRPGDDLGRRGVWAARPELLRASRSGRGWRVSGTKPWCSGADGIERALVTATADDGLLLFDIPTAAFTFQDDWHPLGMRASDSRTGQLDTDVDEPLGPPGCYVERAGFGHGGVGVAACWHGLTRRVSGGLAALTTERDDPHLRLVVGETSALLAAGGALLGAAGRQIDERPQDAAAAASRAHTVRTAIQHVCRAVLERALADGGATALCFATDHARAVGDLTVYLAQFHNGIEPAHVAVAANSDWWTT